MGEGRSRWGAIASAAASSSSYCACARSRRTSPRSGLSFLLKNSSSGSVHARSSAHAPAGALEGGSSRLRGATRESIASAAQWDLCLSSGCAKGRDGVRGED